MSLRPASRSSRAHRPRRRALAAIALTLAAAPPARALVLPDEGRCPTLSGAPDAKGEDALAGVLREGMALGIGDLMALRDLLPPEIWKLREVFFFEGMRLEIGNCHRRYPALDAYDAATRRFAGKARLDDEGNLEDYVAGLPFPADTVDSSASDAALRWAWNLEMRWRGAGPAGGFRLLDLPGRRGTEQVYRGTWFVVSGARPDLEASDYRLPEAKREHWVAGGRFEEPFDARHLAWRQLRGRGALEEWDEPDDTFVYVPTMRKMRRAATAWVDGLYTPRYSVAGVTGGGGGVPFGSGPYGPQGSIQPTAGGDIAATEHMRRGFTGLVLRPNAYVWRLAGEKTVIAPLNASTPGWPESEQRNYGPSGLSVANDRWDVRYAVVVEGRARKVVDDVGYVRLWIDAQTGQPLYWITERPNRLLLDVGILVHRFSGDVAQYPSWPGEKPANVFDPVAAVFHEVAGGGSGWRRESYDVRSVPAEPDEVRERTRSDSLERRGR